MIVLRLCLVVFALFPVLPLWFYYFGTSHSVSNQVIRPNLPDVLDIDALVKEGFEIVRDEFVEIQKRNMFKMELNGHTFEGDMEVVVTPVQESPTSQVLPYCHTIKVFFFDSSTFRMFRQFITNNSIASNVGTLGASRKGLTAHYDYFEIPNKQVVAIGKGQMWWAAIEGTNQLNALDVVGVVIRQTMITPRYLIVVVIVYFSLFVGSLGVFFPRLARSIGTPLMRTSMVIIHGCWTLIAVLFLIRSLSNGAL